MGSPDRLLRAVERGLLPSLVEFGFSIDVVASANRGSSVDLVADDRRVDVHADWLEGELVVELLGPDEAPRTLVRITRLSRGIRASVLEAKLLHVAPEIVATLRGM